MAIQWADDFSRYGTGSASVTAMLDGLPYAIIGSGGNPGVTTDPDPEASGAQRAFRIGFDGNSWPTDFRIALPTVVSTKLGGCFRAWLSRLPAMPSERPALFGTQRSNGDYLAYMRIELNGSIQIVGRVSNALTVVADSVNPIVSPNSWNHYEFIHDKAAGTIGLYVNGILRLSATGLDTADNITLVNFSYRNGATIGPITYIKDLVLWDGTGSFNNDVAGTVVVGRLQPNEDVSIGDWTNPFTSAAAFASLRNIIPYNAATVASNVATGQTFQVGGVYYRYTTGSVDTGTPNGSSANPWLLRYASSPSTENAETLRKAIDGNGVAGTDYSSALTAHPTIRSGYRASQQVFVFPKDGVSTVFTFSTVNNLTWLNTGNMLIGPGTVQDGSYLSAGLPPSAGVRVRFDDLPDDVTSVRALIMVSRHKKSDGGDANIQTALSPNDIDWDTGADRPITTAFQYDFDVSETSPVSTTYWTPVEVNNLIGRVTRTV